MKLFKKREWETCSLFYISTFLSSLFYFAPVFIIVWFRDLGFSLTQIGFLFAAQFLAKLLFEIPTGAIADTYGRKFSVLLGCFLEGVCFIMIFFIRDFYGLLILISLFGVANTLSSGSREAWVTDLIKKNKGRFLQDFFAKDRSMEGFGMFFSGFLGAFLVKKYGLSIVWPVTGSGMFVCLFVLLFAKEYFIKRKVKIKNSYKELSNQTKKAVKHSKKHPVLFYLILAGFFFIFAGTFGEGLSWIPFLQELNFPVYAFGYMWSLMWGVTAIVPLLTNKFFKKGKEKVFLIKYTLLAGIFTLLVYFVKTWAFALLIMLIIEFFTELQRPVQRTYFHKFIPSKLRATIGSVEAMVYSIAAIIALPIVGYLLDIYGPRYIIMLSGILLIPGIICYLLIKEDKKALRFFALQKKRIKT